MAKGRRGSRLSGKGLRRSIRKSPKYALVVLHTRTSSGARGGLDRDGRQKRGVIDYVSLGLDLIIFGFFAGVGTWYTVSGEEESCSFDVPLFLMIAGYTNCVLAVLRFFRPLEGSILQCTFNVAMAIYGSVLVFPNYGVWTSDYPDPVYYCHPIPFLSAFIFVIVMILWYSLILIVVATVFIIGCTSGFKASGPPKDKMFVISHSELERLMKNVKRASQGVKKRVSRKRSSRRDSGGDAEAAARKHGIEGGQRVDHRGYDLLPRGQPDDIRFNRHVDSY